MIHVYSVSRHGNIYVSDNFQVWEFGCNDGTDPVFIDTDLVSILQMVRNKFGKVIIHSAYRTPPYNEKCKGVKYSQHMYGKAADISCPGVSNKEIYNFVESVFGNHGGIGLYKTFVHVDVRNTESARWNNAA